MSEPDQEVCSRRNLGSLISLVVSLISHLMATLVLSLIVIGSTGSGIQGIFLTGTQSDDAMDTESPSLEIAVSSSMSAVDDDVSRTHEMPPIPIQTDNRLTNLALKKTGNAALTSDAFEESGLALMVGGGNEESDGSGGGAGSTKGSPRGSGANFFGAQAYGQRFVFVIDSSTSMIGPRWEALRIELNRALRSLSEDQEFFVISFDFSAHPMFNTLPPKGEFLKPSKENIERLNRWVGSIQHESSTQPASAVGLALRLEPDAIFLLSDGEIRDATLYELRKYNRSLDEAGNSKVTIPIHTVLLHSDVGFMTLKSIADENDGVFTPVSLFRRY